MNITIIPAYKGKIVKFLVRILSEYPQKAIFLTFETVTVGPGLVRKLKWGGGHGPPGTPSGYAPVDMSMAAMNGREVVR